MTTEPRLFVHREVLARIAMLRARPWEVGGWLLGYWDEAEGNVLVTHATPPSRGTPFHIRISGRHHRQFFDQAWEASEGRVTFLGDWHTHPGGPPNPSERDEKAIAQLAEDNRYGNSPPLMLIAGTAKWPHTKLATRFGFYLGGSEPVVPLRARSTDELPSPADQVPDWRWPGTQLRSRE